VETLPLDDFQGGLENGFFFIAFECGDIPAHGGNLPKI
jgi:hypothetical protein